MWVSPKRSVGVSVLFLVLFHRLSSTPHPLYPRVIHTPVLHTRTFYNSRSDDPSPRSVLGWSPDLKCPGDRQDRNKPTPLGMRPLHGVCRRYPWYMPVQFSRMPRGSANVSSRDEQEAAGQSYGIMSSSRKQTLAQGLPAAAVPRSSLPSLLLTQGNPTNITSLASEEAAR
jgi:hypothetical protein